MNFLATGSNSDTIISAGADGWVRYWDTQSILSAEIDGDASIDLCVEPTYEVRVTALNEPCSIRWVLCDALGQHYFIFDSFGKLWKLQMQHKNQMPASCLATLIAESHMIDL